MQDSQHELRAPYHDYWTTAILSLTTAPYNELLSLEHDLENKPLLPRKTCSYTPATSGTHSVCATTFLFLPHLTGLYFQLGGEGVLSTIVADFSFKLH